MKLDLRLVAWPIPTRIKMKSQSETTMAAVFLIDLKPVSVEIAAKV
jgi:hypothetical protein